MKINENEDKNENEDDLKTYYKALKEYTSTMKTYTFEEVMEELELKD